MAGKWSIYNDDLSGIEMVDEDNLASPTALVASASPSVGGVATETTKITSPQTGESVETIKRTPLLDKRSGFMQSFERTDDDAFNNIVRERLHNLTYLNRLLNDVKGISVPFQDIAAKSGDMVGYAGFEPQVISDEAMKMRGDGTLDLDNYNDSIADGWLTRLFERAWDNDQELREANKTRLAEQERLEQLAAESARKYNEDMMDIVRKRNGRIYGEKYDTSKPENRIVLDVKYKRHNNK